jgi:hypothetical protein
MTSRRVVLLLLLFAAVSLSCGQTITYWSVTRYYENADCSDGDGYVESVVNLRDSPNYALCRNQIHWCKSGEPFTRTCLVTSDGEPPSPPHPVQLWLYYSPTNPERRGCMSPDLWRRYSWKADTCRVDPVLASPWSLNRIHRSCPGDGFYFNYFGSGDTCLGSTPITDVVVNATENTCTDKLQSFGVGQIAPLAKYTCNGAIVRGPPGSNNSVLLAVPAFLMVIAVIFAVTI